MILPTWRPSLGAWMDATGASFRVWAPRAQTVEVVLEETSLSFPMEKFAGGLFGVRLSQVKPPALYRYRLDGRELFPDPASRFQPQGVHGPSQLVDPNGFNWTDAPWLPPPLTQTVFYELHVGAFSPEGTFAGAAQRLPYLA